VFYNSLDFKPSSIVFLELFLSQLFNLNGVKTTNLNPDEEIEKHKSPKN